MMENTNWLREIINPIIEVQEGLLPYYSMAWNAFKEWWWIFLPFIVWPYLKYHWGFWRERVWEDTKKPRNILLEVRIPGEILKPMRAMESVLVGFWQIYSPPNWYEIWWEGQYDLSFGLEIVSIEGVPHFLLRIPDKQRDIFESHVYAQYPDAEITEVQDYTKNVPQDIPNDEWDILGTDYTFLTDDCYPLKTYADFETEHESKEEKRVDPMSSLLEGLTKLGKGEQFWVQIKVRPVTDLETGFIGRAKKLRDSLVKREEQKEEDTIIKQAKDTLLYGVKEKKEEKEKLLYPEMMLTPGEREIVSGIERKMSKHIFKSQIRYVYVAKKENFFGGRFKVPMSYFNEFNHYNMGTIIPWGKTITKLKRNWYDWFWYQKRRLHLRKRLMFLNYSRRLESFWPATVKGSSFILSSEELATMFHFPSRITAPPSMIPRVESKKREAPHDLPVEE